MIVQVVKQWWWIEGIIVDNKPSTCWEAVTTVLLMYNCRYNCIIDLQQPLQLSRRQVRSFNRSCMAETRLKCMFKLRTRYNVKFKSVTLGQEKVNSISNILFKACPLYRMQAIFIFNFIGEKPVCGP